MKTGLLAGLFSVLFSATVFAAPVLKINSSGRDVMLLQQKLQNVGYTIKDIDGIFGEETKRVVTPILERSKVSSIISTAKSYIGVPYSFGGATPKAFDCSGYLQYVFGKNGISIPRLADDQYRLGLRTTSKSQLEPGDLVFFTTYKPGPSHCGIYLGDDQFIHASSSRGVRIDSLSNSYWQPRYIGGKHIIK